MLQVAVPAIAMSIAGCEQYRVEYRTVPSFYRDAMAEDRLPERVTLEDGTTIVYQTRAFGRPPARGGKEEEERTFQPVVENDDGSVELHAILPEHVLGNLIYCLSEEKYEACWEQVLSEQTRQAMGAAGEGYEEFAGFLQRNRRELLVMCNRMALGIPRQHVIMEPAQSGVIRMKFRPNVAKDFNFRRLDIITEGFELKLLVIR
jgi:hypothetical protein